VAKYFKEAMNNIIESFIRESSLLFDMLRDSELVREVEEFLEDHSIKNYLMRYDRGIYATEHEKHPHFEIEIKNLKSLENMAEDLDIPIVQEYHRMHKCIRIEKEQYNLYLYNKYK
jgi:hypothetical protein